MRKARAWQQPQKALWRVLGALVGLLGGIRDVHDLEALESHKIGLASYYTVASCQREGTSGVWTASGEQYYENDLTCALPQRPFGRHYRVCGKVGCVTVRQNDYGPGRKPQSRGVIVDLTPRAFLLACGELRQGVCPVTIQEVTP